MEENKEQNQQETQAAEETAGTEARAEDTCQPEDKKKNHSHEKGKEAAEIARLKEEVAQSQDKYLRMLAEYDNYRRRSAKERESVWGDAVADTVKQLLPIADNLGRAIASEGDTETVRHGLEMTCRSLSEVLTKLGVTPFGEVGEAFDPNLHNAVMHAEDPERGENEIAEVFQCGYRMGDKIIRFAMVKVAN